MDRVTAAAVFVQIAQRGSLTAAADALDMSRPMVSRHLAALEQWAGTRLLHRTTRRTALTAAGEQVLQHCQRLLEAAASIDAVGTPPDGDIHGLLRIACAQSLAEQILAPLLTRFLALHPRVALDLVVDARPVNLVEARIDLALRITNHLDPGVVARRLADCESVICAAPSYLAAHGTPRQPAELSLHNCLTYTYFGRSLWHCTDADGVAHAIPVSGNLSANEAQVLLAAAIAGAGITQQPMHTAHAALADGRLIALLPACRPQSLGLYAIYTTRQGMPPALRALVNFLDEQLAPGATA